MIAKIRPDSIQRDGLERKRKHREREIPLNTKKVILIKEYRRWKERKHEDAGDLEGP